MEFPRSKVIRSRLYHFEPEHFLKCFYLPIQHVYAVSYLLACIQGEGDSRWSYISSQSSAHEKLNDCQGLHAPRTALNRGAETLALIQSACREYDPFELTANLEQRRLRTGDPRREPHLNLHQNGGKWEKRILYQKFRPLLVNGRLAIVFRQFDENFVWLKQQ